MTHIAIPVITYCSALLQIMCVLVLCSYTNMIKTAERLVRQQDKQQKATKHPVSVTQNGSRGGPKLPLNNPIMPPHL